MNTKVLQSRIEFVRCPPPQNHKNEREDFRHNRQQPTHYYSLPSFSKMSDDQKDLYESAIAALFSSLHQSTTKEAIQKAAQRRKLTVQDMRSYWNCLQYPATKKKNKKMIHITGTKGKGSTACFCESVLRQNGYSTGLFTSPHLIDIRERIRWNFQPIHTQIFGRAYWKIRKDLELNQKDADLPKLPGYFRMLTLMAYYIFFHEIHVDVIIIEVGIGGRYDATNFWDVRPEDQVVCGVTKLDLDHTRILGNTIEQIAWEKGGIFAIEKASLEHVSPFPVSKSDGSNNGNTSNDTLYVMDSNSSVGIAMLQSCARIEGQGKSIFLVNANGGLYSKISLGLAGQHQYGNANLAVHLCRALFPSKVFDNSNTLKGLADASWPGRCQLLPNHNLTLCLDGAHTVDSMQAVVDWYSKLTDATRGGKLVFTCSHERNPIELLLLLKKLNFQDVYFCSADTHRPSPLDIPKANELLKDHGIQASFDESEATWQETLATIWRKISHPSERQRIHVGGTASTVVKDLDNFRGHVLVTGSLYLVGSFLTAMKWSEESSPHSLRHV